MARGEPAQRPRRLSDAEVDGINKMSFQEFKEAMAAGRTLPHNRSKDVMNLIAQLKELQAERLSLDEKLALLAFAKTMAGEYTQFGLQVPNWLAEAQRTLQADVKQEVRDRLLKEQRELKAQREQHMSAEQKLAMIEQRERELNEKLAALA